VFAARRSGFAAVDPKSKRRSDMKRWVGAGLAMAIGLGAATKTVVGMLRGAPFDLDAVKAALKSYANAAAKAPALFPEGSDGGDTNALPAIWENKADFNARFTKFGNDVSSASAAIVDEATFKATMPGVLKNCGGCHELYRAKKN
jgi:cytochrome c556